MQDEKVGDKVLTVFKLSTQLQHQAKEEAKKKKISFSELLSTKVDDLLNLKTTPVIPKLKKGRISLKATSVLIPEGVHKAARHLSIEHRVTMADIFRFCLSN
jgi:hypothetical protein